MQRYELNDFEGLIQARRFWDDGAFDAALRAFETALLERPRNLKVLLEAARAFGGRFEIARAEELLARAQEIGGDAPDVAAHIAVSYGRIFREAHAIRLLEAMTNRSATVRAELAALYEHAGQLEKALAEIDACAGAAPTSPEPLLAKARILRRLGDYDAARALLPALTKPPLRPALRAEAWTELCLIHARAGDHEGAATAIAEAHGILRTQPQTARLLDRARANNRLTTAMATAFNATTLRAWQIADVEPDPRVAGVAHLLGFPRSGTTLMEQILDAHPGLIASPERAVFTREILPRLCAARGALSLTTLNRVPADVLQRERRRYLNYMEAALGEPLGGRLHLDKNPNHTGLLPALLRLHPAARIVVALRDPRDVVTSCVLRSFRLTEFSAMLLDWGTATELYASEMGVWLRMRSKIDADQWVETRYEDTVDDPMAEAHRVLDTLGLSWDDAVAGYRDRLHGKIVNSPTQTEVRVPVYGSAVGRWRAYRRYLEPHLDRLAPFVKAFGYD